MFMFDFTMAPKLEREVIALRLQVQPGENFIFK